MTHEVSPHVIRTMRERIDFLEERVRQFREAGASAGVDWPAAWGLTHLEAKLLCALYRRRGGYAASSNLLLAVYGPDSDADETRIENLISRLRKKLAPLGIDISNSRGEGRALTPAGIAILQPIATGADPGASATAALTARIAEVEKENRRLSAELAAARAAAAAAAAAKAAVAPPAVPGPAKVIRPRRTWRDFKQPAPEKAPVRSFRRGR